MRKSLSLIFLFLTSCATQSITQPTTPPNTIYKYDISGSVNGTPFNGVGVIPLAKSYDMKIESAVDVDLFTVESCHRDFSVESAIQLGWFETKKGYEYVYNPAPGIEDVGSCLVRIGAYNKDKGQNAWGIIDFETPEATLPAENICDTEDQKTNGVSICQSKVGLIQRIIFPEPVVEKNPDPKCQWSSKDGLVWEYEMPLGECVTAFVSTTSGKIHRHSTVGYTDILIRQGGN